MGSRWMIGGPVPPEAPKPQKSVQRKAKRVSATVETVAPSPEPVAAQGKYKGKTAEQWLAEVGIGMGAREIRRLTLSARIAQADGIMEFPMLFNLMGTIVAEAVHVYDKRFSRWVWRIGDGATAQWFRPSTAQLGAHRRANDEAKGYRVGIVRRPAGVRQGIDSRDNPYYFLSFVKGSPMEIVDTGTLAAYQDR